VFGLNDNVIRFQTGTVAGTITLSATFSTTAGGISLTTTAAPATNIAVRRIDSTDKLAATGQQNGVRRSRS
jgi:hypothetical protein